MIERVIENWLTKAGERTYEVAFCYMLTHQGYTVVHLTRHCPMELGKDIIAIAPDNVPCAFQLKGGDLSLNDWRSGVSAQVDDLVTCSIIHPHPAIPKESKHRPFLVTNGRMAEEVQRVITDKNTKWEQLGYTPLKVLTKGDLLKWAIELGSALWPSELIDVKTIIELHLWDGQDVFPKARLASLLETTFPFENNERSKSPSKEECGRSLASGALLTALAIAPFAEKNNHIAEVEAWTVFSAYTMGLADRWKLPEKLYMQELSLAKKAISNALGRLCEEVYTREYFFEGNSSLDTPFYRIRLTWVMGMLATFALWRRINKDNREEEEAFNFDVDQFIYNFCQRHRKQLELWGEAVIPQFLAYYWLWRINDSTIEPSLFLTGLVRDIALYNSPRSMVALPSPYFEAIDLLPHFIDTELHEFLPSHLRITKSHPEESFAGHSYMLEGLFHLFVRQNFKQYAKYLWPSISKISVTSFVPEQSWQFFRWRNKEVGREHDVIQKHTQSWNDLRKIADDGSGNELPDILRSDPAFALLFTLVYPHRTTTSYIKWLHTSIRLLAR